jgi:hypothetical protein
MKTLQPHEFRPKGSACNMQCGGERESYLGERSMGMPPPHRRRAYGEAGKGATPSEDVGKGES